MNAVRVLGLAGLLAAGLASASGFFHMPTLLGVSGAIMVCGNLYALARGGSP